MRPSASKLGLLAKCQWWARPEVRAPWEPPGPAAALGTLTHQLIEADLTGDDAAVVEVPQLAASDSDSMYAKATAMRDQWRAWWPTVSGDARWNAEMRLAFDVSTGRARELPRGNGHRDYAAATSSEIVGTADAILDAGTHVVVRDWKTGRPENVESATDNRQIAFLGLAAARLFRRPCAVVALDFISTSGVTTDEHGLDAWDLEHVEAEIRADVARIPGAEPTAGEHCKWCPARSVCPAGPRALATLGPERRLPIVGTASEIKSPEHAAYQLAALYAVKAYVNAAWDAVRAYADQHGGIPLGDGKRWARVEKRRESLDLSTQAAVDALRTTLGEHWQKAVDLSTSKTAIREAARVVAAATGRTIADVEREAVQAMRAAGAIKVSTSQDYTEVTT